MNLKAAAWEFLIFGIKEARASIFAGSFFVLLFVSNHLPLAGLPRYDFLFFSAIAIQAILYFTKIETWDEVKVIFLFHIIGLCLEAYKTNPAIGSWSYPEFAYTKIGSVPLYSGFMYAAIGSYFAQAWRIFHAEVVNYKHYLWSVALCVAIYINFFTDNFFWDARWVLIALVFALYWRTRIYFTVLPDKPRWMPLSLAFIFVAFFIWVAENISTYLGAWKYPNQIHQWNVVNTNKITSWFLMVIISFIIVAYLKHFKRDVLHKS